MKDLEALAPSPVSAPIKEGTWVALDEHAKFLDRDLVSGGSPWRLLRLPGASREVARRWAQGDRVRAGEERFARTLVQQGLLHPHFSGAFNPGEIDVVIPVFNHTPQLENLLGQLDGFHVTIVDDGSRDAAAVADCASRYDAALLRLDNNQGPARARNVGAENTQRPLIWFIDADLSMDDAADVAPRLQRAFADPLVAVTAPRVRGAGVGSWRDRFEKNFSPLDMGERSALMTPGGPVGFVPSASLMVRRACFASGFDERLRVGEDVDFVWRLVDRGWLVRYDADVTVTHRARDSWSEWWRQRQRYGASSASLAQRHGERLAPLRVDRWTALAWLLALAGRPALGARVILAARNHARERTFGDTDDPRKVANEVVVANMIRAGGPLARSLVRTFGVALLLAALHPRVRQRALVVFALGTAWRWRRHPWHLGDLPLGVADDLAYGVGVTQGAWRSRSLRALVPKVTPSSISLREILGLRTPSNYCLRRSASLARTLGHSSSTMENMAVFR